MSGDIRYRLNRLWLNSTQASVANFVFFWEMLKFFQAHSGFSFVAYGEATSQLGVTPPSSWLDWNLTSSPPMNEQAWFIVQADNSSQYLDGSGSRQWQLKFQVANGVGFDDCSGHDYGWEGTSGLVACRLSPGGGWKPSALDFDDTTEPASNNMACHFQNFADFAVHVVGDDDTVWWYGRAGSSYPHYTARGGYVGQLKQRDKNIIRPEFAYVGLVYGAGASPAHAAIIGKFESTSYAFANGAGQWHSYSLDPDGLGKKDGTGNKHVLMTWNPNIISSLPNDRWTNEKTVLPIVVRENVSTEAYSVIGEMRLIRCDNGADAQGSRTGDNNGYYQMAENTYRASKGGVLMPWDPLVTPLF